jgi:hypothetical protein
MIFQPSNEQDWHRFFALTPHQTISGRVVWLQVAERRWNPEVIDYETGISDGHWEYRLPLVRL